MISQSESSVYVDSLRPSERVPRSLEETAYKLPGRARLLSKLEFKTICMYPSSDSASHVEESQQEPPSTESDLSAPQMWSEVLHAEEIAQAVAAAEVKVREELIREHEQLMLNTLTEERSRIVKIHEAFEQQKTNYFIDVEAEVVKLALSIATQILHREVKMDPMLLSGVVRVILDKMHQEDSISMHVPPKAADQWHKLFSNSQYGGLKVISDERMIDGECIIDARVGRIDLGVEAQLKEIELGFFDLLHRRPI